MSPEYMQALIAGAGSAGPTPLTRIVNGQYQLIPQPKAPPSGLAGVLSSIGKSFVHPASYFADATIGNPIRELAASFSGNKVAAANAQKRSNRTLMLGEDGKNLTGALKGLAGNSAQLGLTLLAPAAKSIKAGAAIGAGFGGSSALALDKPFEDVAKQAAIGGVIGGTLTGAGKLFSKNGAKAATEVGGTSVTRSGDRALGEVRGVFGGAKIGGSEISSARARELNQFLSGEVGAKGAIATQLEKTANYRTGLTDQLNGLLKGNNYKLTSTEIKAIEQAARARINPTDIPGLSKAGKTVAEDFLAGLKGTKDLQGLNSFRIGLDKAINYARNEASPDPMREQVAMALRKAIDTHLTSQIPEGTVLKAAMSKAYDSEALLGKTVRTMTGGVGDVKALQMIRNSAPVQSARTAIGSKMAGTGAEATVASTPGRISQAFNNIPKMGIAANPLTAALAVRSGGGQPPQAPSDLTGAISGLQTGFGNQQAPAPVQSQYPLEQAIADLRANPNAKTQAQIMAYYDFVSKAEKDQQEAQGGGAVKLDVVAKRQVANIQTASTIIGQLKSAFDKAGGAQGFGGYITNLTSKTPLNASQQAFTGIRKGYTSRIVRALGEVGTLNEGDIQRVSDAIPNYNDSPQSAADKWAFIEGILRDTAQQVYNTASGGSQIDSLADAVSNQITN